MSAPKCTALGEPSKATIQSAQTETPSFCLYLYHSNIDTVFFGATAQRGPRPPHC
jgi:hypothetical protein